MRQQSCLLTPLEADHVGHPLRPSHRSREYEKQHLTQRISHLCLLSIIRQVTKYEWKTVISYTASTAAPKSVTHPFNRLPCLKADMSELPRTAFGGMLRQYDIPFDEDVKALGDEHDSR
jgi:hypothetical protein